MRLEQLKYIVTVAETGSFTEASNRLFIAQPSISQSVSSLEKELQITIFKRYRTGAVPTEAGLEVIAHAKNILNEITEIRNLGGGDSSRVVGMITVGTIPTMGTAVLPHVISSFHTKYPYVQVKIKEAGTSEIIEELLKENMDLGLVAAHGKPDFPNKLQFYKLLTGKLVAYVGDKSMLKDRKKVSFRDLVPFQLFLFSNQFNLHKYCLEELSKYGVPDVISTTHNPEMIKRFVMETDSVGFGPDLSLRDDLYVRQGMLHVIEITDAVPIEFGMVMLKDKKFDRTLKSFSETIIRATP